jgi:pyruvate,water dikinase
MKSYPLVVPFEQVGIKDVPYVGGKNASLGEMITELGAKGVHVPSGFIISAEAYRYFLRETGTDKKLREILDGLDTKNLDDLAKKAEKARNTIREAEFPKDLKMEIERMYHVMEKKYGKNCDVAVRSSATAEDLPGASFAGEHDTYLGIRGVKEVMLSARAAMASLFTDRAISYRVDKGFDHFSVALSVGVQKMVRSDKGASGVMFSIDTESGFPNVVLINASYGLGEMIVQGEVTPDEFFVFKPHIGKVKDPVIEKKLGVKNHKMIYSAIGRGTKQTKIVPCTPKERNGFALTDKEILTLATWAKTIEEHYSKKAKKWTPMDMEWAKDGNTGHLFIVQARPETIHAGRDYSKLTEYTLKGKGEILAKGASVGSKIATGKARVILNVSDIEKFQKGEVLVTTITDPDWEPIMKIASAIVTDKGGRTSHAAIVSRELGIPAAVGTENSTKNIKTGDDITVDCSGSEGIIYKGKIPFTVTTNDISKLAKPKTHIYVNVAIPESAFEASFLPTAGVGLAREEFIIMSHVGLHPMALLEYDKQPKSVQREVDKRVAGWDDRVQFYVDKLAFGIARIGAAFFPRPVIVRFSDFKTNEYRTLIGGEMYEPKEENPMIGWRGASRYYDPKFAPAFKLEVKAFKKVREEMGLTNVIPMVPFCRTPEEGMKTQLAMAEAGVITKWAAKEKKLKNVKDLCPIYVMCEIPANVLRADDFLAIFDGMSIGSNDLTQLTLGLDRDSGILAHIGNEKNPAVKRLIAEIIRVCRKNKKYIGICGQGPSDYPDFAQFLAEEGIESMSLNPDTVVKTSIAVVEAEKKLAKKKKK